MTNQPNHPRRDVRRAVQDHQSKVFRLAYRLTGRREEAEDVAQETFLKLPRRRPDGHPKSSRLVGARRDQHGSLSPPF